ncbi:MAG: PA0069 family radical SAM protein [Planctomycetes bacterium]|nr:PA0069 family radical SAM protein [Planctomycetota bacterium]
MRGRGSSSNPKNRFEKIHVEPDGDAEGISPWTEVFQDSAKSIISENDSPDVGMGASLNPYRGCEHGCSYCYARPYHEYLSMSAGLDFETKIMAKFDAAKLLRKELSAKKWKPKPLMISGVTDAYQPVERKLKITRSCIEVLAEFRNPFGIVTKNALVTRDVDILQEAAKYRAAKVFLSITSLDTELASKLEPRASRPEARLDAIRALAEAGVPVGVMTAPIIPGLNDSEVPAILKAAFDAGAREAGYTIVRLPHGVKDIFSDWLGEHYPDRKEKVLSFIRDTHGGNLNDPRFGHRMSGVGPYAEQISQLFSVTCRKFGLNVEKRPLSTESFRVVKSGLTQLDLF